MLSAMAAPPYEGVFKQDPGMSLTLRYQLLAIVDVGGQPVH